MKLGIIGGSGLYDIPELRDLEEVRPETPFGAPSDALVRGRLGDAELLFLPRHGRGHVLLPSEINHRANIFALRSLGVTRVVAFTAVGSLREDIAPRDLVLPDQYVDRTLRRQTFFGEGLAAHVPFADPVCPVLHGRLRDTLAALEEGLRFHAGGTYVCIEGPAFSTRAESRFYRNAGFDVIGMTSLPEARLAREAGMCYAPVALVTDYDAWHGEAEAVHVEMVVANVEANLARARAIVRHLARARHDEGPCGCARALEGAIMTARDRIPEAARDRLGPILPPGV